jgi:hypothetical protein
LPGKDQPPGAFPAATYLTAAGTLVKDVTVRMPPSAGFEAGLALSVMTSTLTEATEETRVLKRVDSAGPGGAADELGSIGGGGGIEELGEGALTCSSSVERTVGWLSVNVVVTEGVDTTQEVSVDVPVVLLCFRTVVA